MRAQALSLRERTFVKSAVVMGESQPQILFNYIIPNGIFPVIANTTMGMSGAILTEASLSFLGLGDVNVISWGQMIYDGKSYITSAWWIATFAGLAIIFTAVSYTHLDVYKRQLVEDVIPGENELFYLVGMPLEYLETYGDGIVAVCEGGDPYEAFNACLAAMDE